MKTSAFNYPAFRYYISSRLLLIFSVQMQNLVISWLIYRITRDPLSLGLIGIAEILPFLSIVLFAGSLADRFNRKMIMLIAQSVILGTTLMLFYAALFSAALSDDFKLRLYYLSIVIFGFARGFYGPASQAMLPLLVNRNDFTNATTWNTSVFHFAAVAGPALGGLLFGYLGFTSCVILLLGMQLPALLILFIMPYRQEIFEKVHHESTIHRVTSGIRYVAGNSKILGLMSLDLFAVLFGGATAMLPVFASDVLYCGAEGLGWLRAAPAIGALIMAGILIWFPPGKNAGKSLMLSVVSFGLCMILFALSTNFFLSIFLLALSGAFDNISVVIRQTTVQLETPDHMRGRVAAVNSIFIGMSNEIGAFESGLAAKIMGLIPSVIFGGVSSVFTVGVIHRIFPQLARLDMRTSGESKILVS